MLSMKKFLGVLFLFSFLLNFIWEVTQMPLYLSDQMGTRNFGAFLVIHWRVSLFDALFVVVAYILTSLIVADKYWIKHKRAVPWVIFFSGLVVWQAGIEYYSVYIYHRWAYSALMPTIFSVGLSPLLQMIALPLIAILFSRKFFASPPAS